MNEVTIIGASVILSGIICAMQNNIFMAIVAVGIGAAIMTADHIILGGK